MRRRLSLLIAFVGVLGLLGLNPAAQADHDGGGTAPKKDDGKHEGMPTPPTNPSTTNVLAECAVVGTVSIGNSTGTGGVDATSKQHNHYKFKDTVITCVSNPVNDPDEEFAGAFDVDATGGTDGPANPSPLSVGHGEDDVMGWSHSDCYAAACMTLYELSKGGSWPDLYDGTNTNDSSTQCTNCGEISVSNATTGLESVGVGVGTENWVKFVRSGNQVVAWGALNRTDDGSGDVACFLAHLNFTPVNGGPLDGKKVDAARLDGTATVWNGEPEGKSNCTGGKGQK